MSINSVDIAVLKERIQRLSTSQERLAISMNVSPAHLSRMLSRLRPMTEEFRAKLEAAIEWEEKAHAAETEAATDARERVRRERQDGGGR